ncbi:MAG: N-acetyltransferase family protein [Acidobacteriota bacterium]
MLIRPADPRDALAVAQVHVRSWQAAYQGLLPQSYLDQLRPEDRAARYDFANTDPRAPQTLVAVDNGEIIGFATTMPSRDQDLPDFGELCALYVTPEHWSSGVGATLSAAARAALSKLGFRDALLWVMTGNERAERFYRRDGWTADGLKRTDTVWNVTVNELRYRRQL